MDRLLIAAGLGLALFVTTAGSALGIVVVDGMPEQACDAPAAEASRDRVERRGITDPEDCTFFIIDGSTPRP